jgi:predicted HNH restriction endonuclease
MSEQTVERVRLRKAEIVALHGGKCIVCGYNRSKRSLCFHHLDPSTKEFCIGFSGNSPGKSRLLAESKKCILVCANCHGEIEDGLLDVSQYKSTLIEGEENG